MRMQYLATTAAFFLGVLATPLSAQVQAFGGPDDDRKASWVVFAEMKNGFTPHGAVAINYSQPKWKPEYDGMLATDKFRGQSHRLGKNWWTSLETTVAMDIGGSKIAAGSYYLGIQIDKDGAMSLLVIDAKAANQNGWLPFVASQWKTDLSCKLDLKQDAHESVQELMLISITADRTDHSKGTFSIRWGKHELSAAVNFHLPKPAPAEAKKG